MGNGAYMWQFSTRSALGRITSLCFEPRRCFNIAEKQWPITGNSTCRVSCSIHIEVQTITFAEPLISVNTLVLLWVWFLLGFKSQLALFLGGCNVSINISSNSSSSSRTNSSSNISVSVAMVARRVAIPISTRAKQSWLVYKAKNCTYVGILVRTIRSQWYLFD